MRLQNKNFTFNIESDDKPMSRLITSKLVIDNKLTDILVSDLFFKTRKEKNNVIKGYSILQFVKDNKIEINDRVYELSFTGDKDNFVLSKISDPTDFVYNDKDIDDTEISALEKRIEESAPAIVQTQEQPPANENFGNEDSGAILFKNQDYEKEKELNPEFTEYNTSPASNIKLLVNESELPETSDDSEEKIVLIEIEGENSFAILIREEYEIKLNSEEKTFTFEKI